MNDPDCHRAGHGWTSQTNHRLSIGLIVTVNYGDRKKKKPPKLLPLQNNGLGCFFISRERKKS